MLHNIRQLARQLESIHVYVDGPNLFYSGREYAARVRGEDPFNWRIQFDNLRKVIVRGRSVARIVWCMSAPEGAGREIAVQIEQAFDVKPIVLPAVGASELQMVDKTLQLEMHRDLFDRSAEPGKIVLCTGDGAGFYDGSGFLLEAKRFLEWNWKLEVISWLGSCHGRLRALAEREGSFLPLDPFYESVSFIEGGRQSLALSEDDVWNYIDGERRNRSS